MKAHFLKVPTDAAQSFSIRKEMQTNINNRWHYHTELELIHFHYDGGMQFIGDHISRFGAGDIILVGSNLPHYWRYDEAHKKNTSNTAFSTVIHFAPDFWGNKFLELPESRELKMVIEKARKGLAVIQKNEPVISELMEKIYISQNLQKIISLMECLLLFGNANKVKPLSSMGFSNTYSASENERINSIYDFTMNHFSRKIPLDEIASLISLEPNSFCRYFKLRTGKTYTQFLQEIRVGHACKLLIENKKSLKQICFESGFNNFSCFHKGFKLIRGVSPKAYQETYFSN